MWAWQPKLPSGSVNTVGCWWWPRPEPLIHTQAHRTTFLIWCSCQHTALSTFHELEGRVEVNPAIAPQLGPGDRAASTDILWGQRTQDTGQDSHGFISATKHQVPKPLWQGMKSIHNLIARDCVEACLSRALSIASELMKGLKSFINKL